MVYVLIFIFGTIIGSFLNVVILRYNTGNSVFKGRSRCFSCGKTLRWYELVPVFSFLIQRGKCRKCKTKISWQYILVEMTTGLLFLLIFNFQFSIFNTVYLWILASLLIIISVYDLRHFIIPDLFVWVFNFFAFFNVFGILNLEFVWKLEIVNWKLIGLNILGGLIFFSFFASLWYVSKGKWMGFGDAKLALGLGWFLGFFNMIWGFAFSFWIGTVFSIFLLTLRGGKVTLKSKIPFAPFLVAGSLLSFFLDIGDIFHLFYLFK